MSRPIIVGAGPAGLTLAWLLRKKSPIVLEKDGQIGGCHSVRRGPNGEFSEHGPRVYSSTYVTTAKLLEQLGTKFEDVFTPYPFTPSSIGGKTARSLPLGEIFKLALAYFWAAIRPDYYRALSMREFLRDFSQTSIEYFDRLCRLTDGASIDNYSVYKFLQLINQNFGYEFYQPRRPNDRGLFKIWGDALAREGVEIITNATVDKLLIEGGKCTGLEATVSGQKILYRSDMVILAIPPKQLGILCTDETFMPQSGRNLGEWIKDNSYIDYITISYRWADRLNIKSKWGFPSTEWGVASIILSDYFEDETGTLISVGVTNVDAPNGDGKIARNASDAELIDEAFRQLKLVYPELPKWSSAIIGSRIGQESAYIQSAADPTYLPSVGPIGGLYNVGTQNGQSKYSFTSMETAVVNAASLAAKLGGVPFKIATQWTLNERLIAALLVVVVLIIIVILYFYLKPAEHGAQKFRSENPIFG